MHVCMLYVARVTPRVCWSEVFSVLFSVDNFYPETVQVTMPWSNVNCNPQHSLQAIITRFSGCEGFNRISNNVDVSVKVSVY